MQCEVRSMKVMRKTKRRPQYREFNQMNDIPWKWHHLKVSNEYFVQSEIDSMENETLLNAANECLWKTLSYSIVQRNGEVRWIATKSRMLATISENKCKWSRNRCWTSVIKNGNFSFLVDRLFTILTFPYSSSIWYLEIGKC